jgi:ATP-dependent DNA helicase RecQ
VLLLPGTEDREIWHWFATNAMPTQAKADAVLGALGAADGPLSVAALEARVDIRRSPLELLLKVLAVDGAVEYVQGGWVSTGAPWVYDADRYERVAAARVAEQDAMLAYERLEAPACRMAFLTAELDDPHAAPCGRCDTCAAPWYPTEVTVPTLDRAQETLDHVGVPVAPRALWPTGLDTLGVLVDGKPLKGKIPPDEQVAEGRVVARLTDLGWGGRLRDLFVTDADGRPVDAEVPPELGRAIVRVLAGWGWDERPVAVAWVPSLGRPRLVETLASGIASAGRLELLGPLELSPTAEPLRGSTNSAYRVRDVWGRFTVPPAMAERLAALDGPVLLVDDLIDSRWTMAVAGRLLRRSGADAVLPLALASVG